MCYSYFTGTADDDAFSGATTFKKTVLSSPNPTPTAEDFTGKQTLLQECWSHPHEASFLLTSCLLRGMYIAVVTRMRHHLCSLWCSFWVEHAERARVCFCVIMPLNPNIWRPRLTRRFTIIKPEKDPLHANPSYVELIQCVDHIHQ